MIIGQQPSINLKDAQMAAWRQTSSQPETLQEALGRLEHLVLACQKAFQTDQLVITQSTLEDLLAHVLIALKVLELDPDQSLGRALERMKSGKGRPVLQIFSDRVEIRVGDEHRGGWPLFTEADYENALQVAGSLGFEVAHQDSRQLDFFQEK